MLFTESNAANTVEPCCAKTDQPRLRRLVLDGVQGCSPFALKKTPRLVPTIQRSPIDRAVCALSPGRSPPFTRKSTVHSASPGLRWNVEPLAPAHASSRVPPRARSFTLEAWF